MGQEARDNPIQKSLHFYPFLGSFNKNSSTSPHLYPCLLNLSITDFKLKINFKNFNTIESQWLSDHAALAWKNETIKIQSVLITFCTMMLDFPLLWPLSFRHPVLGQIWHHKGFLWLSPHFWPFTTSSLCLFGEQWLGSSGIPPIS